MFDLIFILATLFFSLTALIKGFVKSFFSLFSYILSLLITYSFTPMIVELFSDKYSPLVLNLVVSSVLFFSSIMIMSIFISPISKSISIAMPDSIDKSFGFAFGFTKGFLIFSLIFAIIQAVYSNNFNVLSLKLPKEENSSDRIGPNWLIEAQSYKVLELGSNIWNPIINKTLSLVNNNNFQKSIEENLGNKILQKDSSKSDSKVEPNSKDSIFYELQKINKLYKDIENIDKEGVNKGYEKEDIKKMDRLIETIE
jgi:uncharacterized membrane protein required for colicin V production